jgi:hypothetical protein
MSVPEQIAEAWKVAAADMGFTFVTPFELEEDGRRIAYVGLVPDFGSEKGMLIFVSENFDTEVSARVARNKGFGYSCLSSGYQSYHREAFIAVLDDWGWSPKDRQPPSWYTGAPWST